MRVSKYTKELLEDAVRVNTTLNGVLRTLGVSNCSGGMSRYIKSLLVRHCVDTTHFLGSSWNRGAEHVGGAHKVPWQERLVLRPLESRRTEGKVLRRSLIEAGRVYVCALCGQNATWQNKPLTLEVDHINGVRTDDRAENLRFLCPNCHAQIKCDTTKRYVLDKRSS